VRSTTRRPVIAPGAACELMETTFAQGENGIPELAVFRRGSNGFARTGA
jgi:hypothetical protein